MCRLIDYGDAMHAVLQETVLAFRMTRVLHAPRRGGTRLGATCLVDLQTQGKLPTSNESANYLSMIFHPCRCYVERFVWVWREESPLMLCYARSVHVPSSSDVI